MKNKVIRASTRPITESEMGSYRSRILAALWWQFGGNPTFNFRKNVKQNLFTIPSDETSQEFPCTSNQRKCFCVYNQFNCKLFLS